MNSAVKLKGDQTTARAMNGRLILNLLRQEEPKSGSELATITQLKPAAVTFVVPDLLANLVLLVEVERAVTIT